MPIFSLGLIRCNVARKDVAREDSASDGFIQSQVATRVRTQRPVCRTVRRNPASYISDEGLYTSGSVPGCTSLRRLPAQWRFRQLNRFHEGAASSRMN